MDDLFSINIDERIELIKKYLFDNKLVNNVNLRATIICQLLRKNMSSQACDVKNFTEILDKLLEILPKSSLLLQAVQENIKTSENKHTKSFFIQINMKNMTKK